MTGFSPARAPGAAAGRYEALLDELAQEHERQELQLDALRNAYGELEERLERLRTSCPCDDASLETSAKAGVAGTLTALALEVTLPTAASLSEADAGRCVPDERASKDYRLPVSGCSPARSQVSRPSYGSRHSLEIAAAAARANERQQKHVLRSYWTAPLECPGQGVFNSDGEVSPHVNGGKRKSVQIMVNEESEVTETSDRWYILRPTSPWRITWDLLGMILLFYDTLAIPLAAFTFDDDDLQEDAFTETMSLITLLFWSCDMVASLFTGYVSDGALVVDFGRILKNYAKTWLLLDIVVIVPDWVFSVIQWRSGDGSTGGHQNITKMLRSLRIVRVVRLLRLAKLKRLLTMVSDRIDSEYMFVMSSIAKLICVLLLVNHYIASAWYFIGNAGRGDVDRNWIDAFGIRQDDLGYKYTTSLHWSLTQFTPGSMQVQPTNTVERAFAISVLVFGLIYFSSFVSGLTASISQLRGMRANYTKQLWMLRRYLRQHTVPSELSFRVLRYAEYASISKKDFVPENRIELISVLSPQLRDELKSSVYYSCVLVHSTLGMIMRRSADLAHHLCDKVLQQMAFARNDVIFNAGVEATSMYFVNSGSIQYAPWLSQESDLQKDKTLCALEANDWLSEQTLWMEWHHLGQAVAAKEGQLIEVRAAPFGEIMRGYLELHAELVEYAEQFRWWQENENTGLFMEVFYNSTSKPSSSDVSKRKSS
eukprot:TRINITY_DN29660_c0_g1_i1.p1 TRINITY_DN29660_c0_g1~~TRINITY_DN29660_c0_g1_i1.p1  ORF type:complete len:754 (+),score=124.43 TRINITY_DN29660_c0_g1_i1:132-2264(+)